MSKYSSLDKLTTSIKKRNYKAFIFILGFTLLIWLFVQMSKTYDYDLKLEVKIEKIPQHIVIKDRIQELDVSIAESGFKIVGIHLFSSNVSLSFHELDSLDNTYIFDVKANTSRVAKKMTIPSTDIDISQDTLVFDFYQLATKQLNIQPNFQINFTKGYDSVQNFRFEPSFIEVSGNDSILEQLNYISTEQKVFKAVSDTLVGTVPIKKIEGLPINYLSESVEYTLPVAKFTEGSFEIPIEIEGAKPGEELVIFPKTVKVNFKTSLSNYEKIDESGFKVIARYQPEDEFMRLYITEQPKLVKNVSLENYKVDYLIKK